MVAKSPKMAGSKDGGGTPLNNPPIEIHANSSMFALGF